MIDPSDEATPPKARREVAPSAEDICAQANYVPAAIPPPDKEAHHAPNHWPRYQAQHLTENSMYEPEDSPRPHYYLARLETIDGQDWTSLHTTGEDAERKLRLVGEAWGVGFTLDGEPADGFRFYGVEYLPVLSSEDSNEPPEEETRIPVTREEAASWDWLVMRDVPGGLSADEMADDLGIPIDVAVLRLASLAALDVAYEVSPGRYRPGRKDA